MNSVIKKIKAQQIIPLFYSGSFEASAQIIKTLYEADIRVIEYTNRGVQALENFRKLKEISAAEFPDLLLGIGTVRNVHELNEYAEVKADFIITPVVSKELVRAAEEKNILLIPGCFTPSEVNVAYQLGIRMVKIFPADALGKNYIKSIKPIFPEMEFMLTGGITADHEEIKSWMNGGAAAVGLGSALLKKDISHAELTATVKNLLKLLNQ